MLGEIRLTITDLSAGVRALDGNNASEACN